MPQTLKLLQDPHPGNLSVDGEYPGGSCEDVFRDCQKSCLDFGILFAFWQLAVEFNRAFLFFRRVSLIAKTPVLEFTGAFPVFMLLRVPRLQHTGPALTAHRLLGY